MPKQNLFLIFKKISILILILALAFFSPQIFADENDPDPSEIKRQIQEYTEKIKEAQAKQQTLASTIAVLDNQIYLTTAQIQLKEKEIKTLESEIEDLSKKILQLDTHLETTSIILKQRIEETYKRMYVPNVQLMFMSDNFSDFYSRIKYLQTAQKHDKELMFAMEETKQNFDKQKLLKEQKQLELEKLQSQLKIQSKILANQKYAKQDLLNATKNDEKQFQTLLSRARAEYEAIQAIIAGKGEEEKVRDVKQGENIASVISGSSCNSSGTHLHFSVNQVIIEKIDNKDIEKRINKNPFNYLQSIDYKNCSGGISECIAADPFNPSGNWSWPLSSQIMFTQGYGHTWSVDNISWLPYDFHNGIDIRGSSNDIKAVQDGTLYRGSYIGNGGCRLRYVRVDHKDSDLETLYLHVNY